MSTATRRRSSILRLMWTFAVLGAVLVTLPLLLALACLVLFSVLFEVAAVGAWSLERLLIVLWPAAGVAGIVGLILARSRGPLGLHAVRARQALLLAGIAAAVPPAAALAMAALADPQPRSAIALGVAAPFVVLILQGARDTWRLQALIARPAEPEPMLSTAFLWLALICAVGAAAGHLAL